jgi:hypothetical protein
LWNAWQLTRRVTPRDQVRVMKRDAYGRLDENSYPSFHRAGPDVPLTPWCIRLADNAGLFRLLCFDFDGKDKAGVVLAALMERAVDDCDQLSATLTRLGIDHVVCQSSRSGGRHIWISLHHGAPASVVAGLARVARANYRTLDHGMLLNPREGAARPPLSPHRDGSNSIVLRGRVEALIEPTVTTEDLAALTQALELVRPASRVEDTQPSGPVDAAHAAHRPLSAWGTSHMATIDGGTNPSWTGFMCLLAAATAGWTLRDIQHAARTAPGMEHYRTKNTGRGNRRARSRAEAAERLTRQWGTAQQYSALHRALPASQKPRDVTELTELDGIVTDIADLLHRFTVSPGRWGITEAAISQRSILTAIAYLTLQTGKREVAASIRDLALMTGLGRTTAATSLRALQDAGFVARATASDGSNAAEWRLTSYFSTTPRIVRPQPFNNPRPPNEIFSIRAELVADLEQQLTDQRHDLFTRGGLGHLAGKIYSLLRNHSSLTVETAASLLGVSPRHTATILSRLRVHRLIIRHLKGWARSKRDLRDHAARLIGVAGILIDRARRYQAERDVWAWWQAEVATMTSNPRNRPRRPGVTARPLFESSRPGERSWPRYPRTADRRGDHRAAIQLVLEGALNPESRWQYLGEVA